MKETERKMYGILGRMLEIRDAEGLQAGISALQSGKYKYLLCFDMGCGNTSAVVTRIDDYDNNCMINWEYRFQDADGRIQTVPGLSIPTIFGYDDDEPVIGPEAMIYGEAVENFKAIPNEFNLDHTIYAQVGDFTEVPLRRIWKRYFDKAFHGALAIAKKEFPDISRENVIFVVARPADHAWEANLDSYKRLILSGTGLPMEQIMTFSEAKASMQYVRIEKALSPDWKKGVIVIDLGASTIDVEYLAYDRTPLEYSITMAGKEVDRLLGHAILAQIYPQELAQLAPDELPDEAFFRTHLDELFVKKRKFAWNMRNMKEDICRGAKKNFYYTAADGTRKTISVDGKQLDHILTTEIFSFVCSDPFLAAYMNAQAGNGKPGQQCVRGSWYQHLERLVSYVLTEIGKTGSYADQIIVTGGTANLIGIEHHIRQSVRAAGWTNTGIVVLDQEADYERTVPYGSASYLTNVIQHIPQIVDFPEALEAALKTDLIAHSAAIIRNKVAPIAVNKVKEKIDAWAGLPAKDAHASVNALKQSIGQTSLAGSELDAAVDQAIAEIRQYVNSAGMTETMQAINAFLAALSLNKQYDHPIAVSGIQCRLEPDAISAAVQASFATLGFGVLVTGFFNDIRYLFTGDDSPSSPKVRRSVQKNFPSANRIHADLLPPIRAAFSEAFDASDGFGMLESILTDLETDINQAMFIG